jgi:type IX secretion system PorP/SprF family membrane protein
MLNKSLEGSKLLYENMNDDRNAIMTDRSLSAIDIDLGAQIYYRKLQAGFSSTHLQQSEGDANTLKTTRHYYGYLKYIITASEKVSLIPTVLMKATGFINQYDINCTGYYNNEYWAGLSYRTEKAVVMMLGLNILKDMRLGYSYDFNFGELRSNSSGSHEIMLAYKFKDINRHPVPLKSPRFF